MPLTDVAVKRSKHRGGSTPTKLPDGRGLYLFVLPTGTKSWRFLYRFEGKQKTLTFGLYPDISLKEAREFLDTARNTLARGADPGKQKWATRALRNDQLQNTFESIALEWHSTQLNAWSADHGDRVLSRLKNNLFPWLGSYPITDITAPKLLEVIRRIEARGAYETAHRTLNAVGQIFRFAAVTGRLENDVTFALRNALKPVPKKHFAAIVDPNKVGPLLATLNGYKGSFVTRCALRLAPMVFVRPGELRKAKWSDIDLDAGEWRYEVTKTKTPHIVPLSTQGESLKANSGVFIVHVPYRGAAPAVTDLLGNQIPVGIVGLPPVVPHERSGKLKILAVTSAKRSSALPGVPSVAETKGMSGFRFTNWMMLYAPAGTPQSVIDRIANEITSVVNEPTIKEKLLGGGVEPMGLIGSDLTKFIQEERSRYAYLVKTRGISATD